MYEKNLETLALLAWRLVLDGALQLPEVCVEEQRVHFVYDFHLVLYFGGNC